MGNWHGIDLMADPLRKISAGVDEYPLSASYRNAVVEMLKWFNNQGGARGIGRKQVFEQTGIIDCKNISGGTLARFSALAIVSVFPDPSDNEVTFANGPILRGDTPTASTDPGNFCVLLAPAKDDVIVPACISGVCVAKVNVNDESDTTCGVSTTTVLQSGESGAQILWKESGTGVKWAVIRVGGEGGGFDRIQGTLTAATTGSDFTIDNVTVIQGKNPLDDPDDTAETVAVVNTMSWNGDDNAIVFAQWNKSLSGGGGAWQAFQIGCPA